MKFLFIIVFLIISISSAWKESITFDEVVHIQEGKNAWIDRTFAIDTNNPPLIRELQVIPFLLHVDKMIPSPQPNLTILPARMVTILFGVILLLFVMSVTKKYFGYGASVFAGFLFTFEPSILANSHYVTQDMGVTLLFFISYIVFLTFLKNQSVRNVIVFAITTGFGMASKITFIPFLFISTVVVSMYRYVETKRFKGIKAATVLVMFVVVFLTIWSTYFFKTNVVIVQRSDSSRVSSKVITYAKSHNNAVLLSVVNFLQYQPVPLGDYFGTLKNIALRRSDSCFFLGSYTSCQWYFMPVTLLLKIPIPFLIFFAVSLYINFKNKKTKRYFLIFSIPVLSILFVAVVFRMPSLVRYVLPLFPFLIIASAAGIAFWMKSRLRFCLFVILVLWYSVGTLQVFPHFLSYANEITFGKKHTLLMDSNMDWGQSLLDVATYHKDHPLVVINFSYFGRDNGDGYGLQSDKPYGSYKNNEICEFHVIGKELPQKVTLISISNWYACGYNKLSQYNVKNIKGTVGNSIFVF